MTASVDLVRGEKVAIGLRRLTVGLGWDPTTDASGNDYDLDAAAFLLGADRQIPHENYFVFYNNLISPDGAVTCSADARKGRGSTESETITVELDKLDSSIREILFTVTTYKGDIRGHTFGHVRNAFIRISDGTNGQEICKYDLEEDFAAETGIEFGRLYQEGESWKFEAIGTGSNGGLAGQVKKYARQFAP